MNKLALLGAVAALMTAGSANAEIITFDTPITISPTFDGTYINLGTGTFGNATTSGWDFNPYAGPALLFYWGGDAGRQGAGVAADAIYQDLADGTLVSQASVFSQNAQSGTASFRTTGVHTLGFQFFNEATNALNYGYLRMQTQATTGFPATVLGWSYDNTGAGIAVGDFATAAVPEPATWGMMLVGFGMIGFGMRRRKSGVRTRVRFA